MLPQNRLSSVPATADLLAPDASAGALLTDWEMGGVALNDPTQGIAVRPWRCYLAANGLDVCVQSDPDLPQVIFSQAGILSLSFCFDQNMRPCVVYETVAGTFLRWFDSSAGAYVTTPWGTSYRNARVALDDKRPTQFALRSDIIFAYIRSGNLCYRQQRDRFTVERVLQTGISGKTRLVNMGMNKGLRFQFDLV